MAEKALVNSTTLESTNPTLFSDALLTAPTLTSPSNEAKFNPYIEEIEFEWGSVGGAVFYVIQIAPSSDFKGPGIISERVVASTSLTQQVYE